MKITTLIPLTLIASLAASAAVRADETWHDRIVSRSHGTGSRGVLLRGLHPVGTVTELDLRHFLEDPGNSNCPPARVPQVAAAIFARSGGVFQRACIEIEGALEHGWYDLVREGEAALGEPTDPW